MLSHGVGASVAAVKRISTVILTTYTGLKTVSQAEKIRYPWFRSSQMRLGCIIKSPIIANQWRWSALVQEAPGSAGDHRAGQYWVPLL